MSRSISESPLDFEITRVDCMYLWRNKKKIICIFQLKFLLLFVAM